MVSNPSKKFHERLDVPSMSDSKLLVKVEDLIALTFGTGDQTNVINLKILQTILHILAGKMRMLEQNVEIRFAEEDDILVELKTAHPAEMESVDEGKKEEAKKDDKTGKPEKDSPPGKSGKSKSAKGSKGDKKGKGKKSTKGKGTSLGSVSEPESQTRVPSIELVTASQFNLLDSMVQRLLKRTGGVPLPTMPSNEELLAEVAKGTASLPDTMEAMQHNARIRAVEHAVTKMASLLQQLASSGALPDQVAAIITLMKNDLEQLALITGIEPEQPKPMKSIAAVEPSKLISSKSIVKGDKSKMSKSSKMSKTSKMSKMTEMSKMTTSTTEQSVSAVKVIAVTHPEMHDAVNTMRDELLQKMDTITSKAEYCTDQASRAVKVLAEKMDVALKLDDRITAIQAMTGAYSLQLQGFDAGLNSQLQNFKEQMAQIRNELAGGLVQLEAANSNAESAALIDLKSTYENLLLGMDQTTNNHGALVLKQKNLTGELKNLVENVELLREEKADRDEVADGLRDKANINRLKSLLRQPLYEETRKNLEHRLNLSYDKFYRQDQTWMTVMKELNELVATKACNDDLIALREHTINTLDEHFQLLRRLEYALGEAKTALLTRQLASNARSGPSMVSAEMEVDEKPSQVPPKLPAWRKEDEVEEPCMPVPVKTDGDASRKHACKRWVGGSHTLLSEHVTQAHPTPSLVNEIPTKQYTGLGNDGRLYKMEEELQPCIECNKISSEEAPPPSEDGGGDVA